MSNDLLRQVRRAAATVLLGGALTLAPAAVTASSASATTTGAVYVWIDGWGSGTVTSSPVGINCHLSTPAGYPYDEYEGDQTITGPCQANFPAGTVVTMTATPDPGSNLNGPMDCGTEWGNPCKRTVVSGYNSVWAMFCLDDGLCSAGW